MPALAPLGLSLMMGDMAPGNVQQTTNESVRQADNSDSFYFDGPQNTTNQGNPVQLLCGGKILVGAQTVSFFITIDQLM
ncbi:hypothetical protein QM042_01870 [Escherichia coli]